MRCPRCRRPDAKLRADGRIASHRLRRLEGHVGPVAMPNCPASGRMPEHANLRVSPLRLVVPGARGLSASERREMREDAVRLSGAIDSLDFDGTTVAVVFSGARSYDWRCGLPGWQLLWKVYRREGQRTGRLSLGRAVHVWRAMPSIKKAAGERLRRDLAVESTDLCASLR